jgi:hypothetical protein
MGDKMRAPLSGKARSSKSAAAKLPNCGEILKFRKENGRLRRSLNEVY